MTNTPPKNRKNQYKTITYADTLLTTLVLLPLFSTHAFAQNVTLCQSLSGVTTPTPAQHFLMGEFYRTGQCGYTIDKIKYKQEYRLAAEAGQVEAQYKLGEIFFTGDGDTPNYIEAKKWFLKAAQQGHGSAALRLGFLYAENHYEGLTPDLTQAEHWFLFAAEKQAGDAAFRLGNFYSNYKIPRDHTKAFLWLTRAAEAGHRTAMFDLGRLYLEGKGTKKNIESAIHWLEKAAEKDDLQAQMKLCELYRAPSPLPDAQTRFVKWMLRIAASPKASGYWLLQAGDAFDQGLYGIPPNPRKALAFYTRAAAKGEKQAQDKIKRLTASSAKP